MKTLFRIVTAPLRSIRKLFVTVVSLTMAMALVLSIHSYAAGPQDTVASPTPTPYVAK